MQEHRMFQRFNIEIPVKFRSLSNNIEGSGKLINISAGGGGMIVTIKYHYCPNISIVISRSYEFRV